MLLFSLLVIVALVLGACAAPPAPATGTDAAAGEAPAGGEATVEGDAAASSGEPVTITWWSWNGGPPVPGSVPGDPPQLVVEFNKLHPDVQVEWKFYQYVDYLNALKLAIASGEGPDLFGLQAGALVSEYNEFTEDLTPYAASAWGEGWQDQFYPLGFDGVAIGDKLPGMPLFNSAAGQLWYNKTILDKYDLQPPTTLEEWVSACETLNAAGETCFVQGAKDAWVNFDMYIALANEIAPGKIYEAEAGTVAWTDPDLVQAMELWGQMFSNGIMQNGALGISQYPDANEIWQKGEAAMILFGMWNNSVMTNSALDDMQAQLGVTERFEFLPILFPDVNGDGQPGRLFGGPDVVLAMNASSEQKDAAWTFIEWATAQDGGQQLIADAVSIPSVKGLTLNDGDIYTDAQKESLKQQLLDLENAGGKREFAYPELKTALGDALQNVATGTQTAQQALEAVEQVSQTIQR
jgi:raffinose/stachyose/melibiose transport system substrate-binding protein